MSDAPGLSAQTTFSSGQQLLVRCVKGVLAALFLAAGMALASRHPLWPVFILVVFYAWAVVSAFVPRLWLFVVPAALPALSFAPWTGWFFVDEFDLLLLATLAGGFARGAFRPKQILTTGQPAQPVQPNQTNQTAQTAHGSDGVNHPSTALSTLPSRLNVAFLPTLLVLLTVATVVSLSIGLVAASQAAAHAAAVAGSAANTASGALGWPWGLNLDSIWVQGYADPANALRIFKSFGFAALFIVLLRADLQTETDTAQGSRFLGLGMCVGLTVVTLVVLWERLVYPGVLEFSTRYRTTALFWEMHVGGAAIDAYLAMATPFVAWALWSAKRVRQWFLPALLALLTCYAALTTFSRGVYLATALPVTLLALVAWFAKVRLGKPGKIGQVSHSLARRLAHVVVPADWHGKAGLLLGLLIASEIAVVFSAGTFMRERLEKADSDLSSRMAHWSRGLTLPNSAQDWLWGRGLGRLPADYAQISDETEFSGSVQWVDNTAEAATSPAPAPAAAFALSPTFPRVNPLAPSLTPTATSAPRQFLALSGPLTNPDLGGLYSLSQRIELIDGARYQLQLKARALVDTELLFKVCEKHLLYEARCQSRYIKMRANTAWQAVAFPLRGRFFLETDHLFRKFGVLSVTVLNEGGRVDIANLQALSPKSQAFLENSDFSHGMERWGTSAGSYYLPWHIDNLYLEVLIERGAIGFLLLCSVAALALKRLVGAGKSAGSLAPFLAASLVGVLLLGLVSSVMDVPRVAFMFFLLLFYAIQLTQKIQK